MIHGKGCICGACMDLRRMDIAVMETRHREQSIREIEALFETLNALGNQIEFYRQVTERLK